jgi:DNA-binding transcriptional MerR regulator
MGSLLMIGEFSRMTHLSVKALRHYDDVGLLKPAGVDPGSGYRLYSVAQIPAAQVIRRFRDLDMPIDQIKEVLVTEDPNTRDKVILQHLGNMQAKLDQTQSTIASLRALLEGGASGRVEHRQIPSSTALAIRARVGWDDAEGWLGTVFEALHAALERYGLTRSGPDGALYSDAFFEAHDGEVVAFTPTSTAAGVDDRTLIAHVPGGLYVVMMHEGPFAGIDTTYGAAGSYVTEQAIAAPGPIRENYVVSGFETDDPAALRTEVCWPIQVPRS